MNNRLDRLPEEVHSKLWTYRLGDLLNDFRAQSNVDFHIPSSDAAELLDKIEMIGKLLHFDAYRDHPNIYPFRGESPRFEPLNTRRGGTGVRVRVRFEHFLGVQVRSSSQASVGPCGCARTRARRSQTRSNTHSTTCKTSSFRGSTSLWPIRKQSTSTGTRFLNTNVAMEETGASPFRTRSNPVVSIDASCAKATRATKNHLAPKELYSV